MFIHTPKIKSCHKTDDTISGFYEMCHYSEGHLKLLCLAFQSSHSASSFQAVW